MRWSILLCLVGCGPDFVEGEQGGLRHVYGTANVGASGKLMLHVDVGDVDSSLLLTVRADGDSRTHMLSVTDPSGVERFEAIAEALGGHATTNAGFVSPVVTMNWPRVPDDALVPGRWSVLLGNVARDDTYASGSLHVSTLFKSDTKGKTGTVPIALVYAGSTNTDEALRAAVGEAMLYWDTMYAAVGLELDVVEAEWPDGEVGAPALAYDQAWEQISEQTGPNRVNIVIVPDIIDIADVLGVAGDIPGPLVATTRSGVLVNALLAAGPDGNFDPVDVQLLGETMAHETGHYLGVFHPVEAEWDSWDGLDDTDECTKESSCVSKLGEQLMFPFPLCDFTGCTPQEEISADQGTVMNGYTGVGP
jgi:hypothetical protein